MSTDALLVDRLYHLLIDRELKVWYDKKCLRFGQRWEHGFVDGLRSSLVMVPVLSRPGLAPFEDLRTESPCDNVLLEHTLAIELKERTVIWGITPLLVGESTAHNRDSSKWSSHASSRRGSTPLCSAPPAAAPEAAPSDPAPIGPARIRSDPTHPGLRRSFTSRARCAFLAVSAVTSAPPRDASGGEVDRSGKMRKRATSLQRTSLRPRTTSRGSTATERRSKVDFTLKKQATSSKSMFGRHKHELLAVEFELDFFKSGGVPSCDDGVEVTSVWTKVATHLRRVAAGFVPLSSNRSVKSVLDSVLAHQGVKLRGTTEECLQEAAAAIAEAVTQAKAQPHGRRKQKRAPCSPTTPRGSVGKALALRRQPREHRKSSSDGKPSNGMDDISPFSLRDDSCATCQSLVFGEGGLTVVGRRI